MHSKSTQTDDQCHHCVLAIGNLNDEYRVLHDKKIKIETRENKRKYDEFVRVFDNHCRADQHGGLRADHAWHARSNRPLSIGDQITSVEEFVSYSNHWGTSEVQVHNSRGEYDDDHPNWYRSSGGGAEYHKLERTWWRRFTVSDQLYDSPHRVSTTLESSDPYASASRRWPLDPRHRIGRVGIHRSRAMDRKETHMRRQSGRKWRMRLLRRSVSATAPTSSALSEFQAVLRHPRLHSNRASPGLHTVDRRGCPNINRQRWGHFVHTSLK
jgi:hypothetical protein